MIKKKIKHFKIKKKFLSLEKQNRIPFDTVKRFRLMKLLLLWVNESANKFYLSRSNNKIQHSIDEMTK